MNAQIDVEELYGFYLLARSDESAGLNYVRPIAHIGTFEYEFDFVKMFQKNLRSNRTRPIRRLDYGEDAPAFSQDGFTFSTSRSLGSAVSLRSKQTRCHSVTDLPVDDCLRDIFHTFGGGRQWIDRRTFVKLCRDSGLLDRKFRDVDADIVFTMVAQYGNPRIDLQRFDQAMAEVARRRGVSFDGILSLVRNCPGPLLRATSPERVRLYHARTATSPDLTQSSPFTQSSPMLHSENSVQGSRRTSVTSPRRSRASTSPGPAAYHPTTHLQQSRVRGGSYFGTGHKLDLVEGRSNSPGPQLAPHTRTQPARGGGYFGTGHLSTTRAAIQNGIHDVPGPGSYCWSSPRHSHVPGVSFGTAVRDFNLVAEI
jgi:hypothetical protein